MGRFYEDQCTLDHSTLTYSYNKTHFRQKLYIKSKHMFFFVR